MPSPARAERAALCDLFLEVGPDAPTLCGAWTTRDLAAHLVVRERRPDAAPASSAGSCAAHRSRCARGGRAAVDRDRRAGAHRPADLEPDAHRPVDTRPTASSSSSTTRTSGGPGRLDVRRSAPTSRTPWPRRSAAAAGPHAEGPVGIASTPTAGDRSARKGRRTSRSAARSASACCTSTVARTSPGRARRAGRRRGRVGAATFGF